MDGRERGRALLARQHLLKRSRFAPVRMVEHLLGMQAQTPRSPYTALWSRLENFDPMTVSRAIQRRRLVRIALMRSTIHLVSASDALMLRPLIEPIVMREITSVTWRRQLVGVDLELLAVRAREIVETEPLTPKQLGAALSESFPDNPPAALAHAARSLLPLVQVPPRGLWDSSGATRVTTAEHWLGAAINRDSTWDAVVLRYLAAFGPASAADAVAWAKVPGMVEVFDRLRPQLIVLHDDRGRELFDLPRAPRPPASTPAPPRFLPDYDNALLSHVDRAHLIIDEARKAIWTSNGVLPGTVLVDGSVAAAWSIERDGTRATLQVRLLRDVSRADRADIDAEGGSLLAFLAADAARHEVSLHH